jgi:hypothetical protein
MLHKLGTMFDWNGVQCDYVIVADEDEAEIALADNYQIGRPDPDAHVAPRRGRPPKKDTE